MIAALLLLAQAVTPIAPPPILVPSTVTTAGMPPQDWTALPVLRIRKQASTLANTSAYVHGEVMAGRCVKAIRTMQGWSLTLDLAVLMTPDGRVRRVTPRAIDCPTVEQYAAGVILGARDSIDVVDTDTDTWYRTSLTFAWGA
ncbi:hypothetical protein C8J45_101523 [Sphingomonas sp. PP-CE-3G-477]|uniref:hypothetical protein n=1 Tax=Sphingomonas sp. PP-CE-3G-477 TaxID=2135660 RepID=UPI000D3753E1|nr:hypothetical protein [Sphingomonas sp. PP-CE-3G-477]PTQ65671.1 hypothetical protein C8J45_101523 [Sphingomonas sp. PP-CE-3G-477]